MPSKKKPSGLRKITYGYSRAWRKPQIKLLHVLVFAAIFGWLGYQVVSSHAEGPVPSGADEIVVQYDPMNSYQAIRQPDGTIANLLPPGEVIITGDGSLFCNTAGDGTVSEGNIGLGIVKQLYNTLNTPDAQNVVANQHASPPDSSQADEHAATITVHGNAEGWAISSEGENSGVFNRMATIVQHKCQGEYATHRVTSLPEFKDVNDGSASVGWLGNHLFSPAYALSSSYSSTATQNLVNLTNSHRSSHYGLRAYSETVGSNCLFKHSVNGTYYGAEIWTTHEATYQATSHDPNLAREVNVCSGGHWAVGTYGYDGSWTAYGQNAAGGFADVNSMFSAYLNSCEHHVNIDDRSVTWNGKSCSSFHAGFNRTGTAVNIDSSGKRWSITTFAAY